MSDRSNGGSNDGIDPSRFDDRLAEGRGSTSIEFGGARWRRLRRRAECPETARYRNVAAIFVTVGLLAGVGAVIVPDARTVLTALMGTGLFVAALIYVIAPVRVVPAATVERLYRPSADDRSAFVSELGLSDERVYVPGSTTDDTRRSVRLFVPRSSTVESPPPERLQTTFVGDIHEPLGLAFRPLGNPLYKVFVSAVTAEPPDEPIAIAEQLSEAIVELFELADSATVHSAGEGYVRVVVVPVVDRPDRFDHPVSSLFGVALAETTGRPVSLDVDELDEGEYAIACRWRS